MGIKDFGHKGLASLPLFVTTAVAVCLITFIFYWLYYSEVKEYTNVRAAESRQLASNASAALQKRLMWPAKDTYYLSETISDVFASSTDESHTNYLVQKILYNLIQSRGTQYTSIYFLNNSGQPLIHLERNQQGELFLSQTPYGGKSTPFPDFFYSQRLQRDEIYVSNLDQTNHLNLNFIARVFSNSQSIGYVSITYSGDDIVKRITGIDKHRLWLTDNNHNILYKPKSEFESVIEDYNDVLGARLDRLGTQGQLIQNNHVISFQNIKLDTIDKDLPFSIKAKVDFWRIVNFESEFKHSAFVANLINNLTYYYLGVLIISIAIAAYIGILWHHRQAIHQALTDRNKELNEKNLLFSHLATTDFLTGLHNRQNIERLLAENINLSNRHNRSFSMMFIDIDHFKRVNDEHGHDVGDIVLKEFTNVVSNNIRNNDKFGRWGGEEFIIIAPETNQKEAVEFAEKIRKALQNHHFSYDLSVTASIGVTQYRRNESLNTLLKRADNILYNAKRNGRNRVEYSTLSTVKRNQ